MYHGTTPENAALIMKEGFKPSKDGMLGPGVYVSGEYEKAKRYGTVVLKLSVLTGKIAVIDH